MAFPWDTALVPTAVYAVARVDGGWIYYVGLAVVVIVLAGTLIAFYRTWVEIHEDEEPDSPQDLMDSFREAHAAGEIDDGELERVRQLLLTAEDPMAAASRVTRPLRPASARQIPGKSEGIPDLDEPDAIEPRSG